jgi:hypothetical protein
MDWKHLKVGDPVVVTWTRTSRSYHVKVTKIGRKYFYVDGVHRGIGFDLVTGDPNVEGYTVRTPQRHHLLGEAAVAEKKLRQAGVRLEYPTSPERIVSASKALEQWIEEGKK